MQLTFESGTIEQKTRDLCQTIVDEAGFRAMKVHIDAFLGDEDAKRQYQVVAEKSEELHYKQHQGEQLTQAEIADFETKREALMNNPVARSFLEAQEQMRKVQDTIQKYVTKTMEVGHVPAPEDFETCGHGCSCGH